MPPLPDPTQNGARGLLKRLRNEERSARDEYDRARQDLDKILDAVPSGLPHPDGADRIHNAGNLVRFANENYRKAHKRLMDFLVHGIVPESSDENR